MTKRTETTTNDHTMRALIQPSRGGPADMITVSDAEIPEPAAGELLVRVTAAGLNFADALQTRGLYRGGPKPPYVAGFEAVGEVVGVGSDDARQLFGHRVVGTGPGAFAQYMTMPAAAALPVPEGWADHEALGMVLNWATAVAALVPLGGVRQGSTVLVHAAAGGVGQAAVQLAVYYGAQVIATASPAKHDAVRALGVDDVFDVDREDLKDEIMQRTGGVDLVLESVGATTLATSLSVTKPFGGRVVVFGAASGDVAVTASDLIFKYQVDIIGLHIQALAAKNPQMYRQVMSELERLIAAGVYTPGRAELHPLADGPGMLTRLESRLTTGKHGLDPWS